MCLLMHKRTNIQAEVVKEDSPDDAVTPVQVFSATFKGQETTQGNATTSTPPTVQVESVAPTSNLEVLAVNLSALNNAGSIEAFSGDFSSPAEQEQARLAAFCRELLSENPGLMRCFASFVVPPPTVATATDEPDSIAHLVVKCHGAC
jgi:hypothetical protein